jgi:predicted SAM-dependent methyltransferase
VNLQVKAPWRRRARLSPAEGPRVGIVALWERGRGLPAAARGIRWALSDRVAVFPVSDLGPLDDTFERVRAVSADGDLARDRWVVSRGTRLVSWLRDIDVLIAFEPSRPRFEAFCAAIGVRSVFVDAAGRADGVAPPPALEAWIDAGRPTGEGHEQAALAFRAGWRALVQRVGPRVLNLGAGGDQHPGAIHLDIRPVSGVEVVGSAQRLPFADASFDAMLAQDLLEHFPGAETGALLDEWVRVLRPGGSLRVQTPDLRGLARALTRKRLDTERVVEWLYGAQDHPYNFHYTGFDEARLRALLAERGIEEIVRRRDRVSSKNVCLEGRRRR